ncbi:helix-turn-helix domain-containing protein, partial [Rhodanobacter lindaniclasticus]|uniref:helix-turn-helix domain-containing protein n=1 Tax=Rhodanobacter lindaniclasticus TaxID=75310 RepID=UPI00109FC9E6
MTASIALLDKFAKACNAKNDSDTARALRVQPSAVNNWRHDRAKPSAATIEKMCKAIGEPTNKWLPLIEAERARNPEDRKAWLRLAQAAAAVAMMYTFSRLDVHHEMLTAVVIAARNPGSLYIMS